MTCPIRVGKGKVSADGKRFATTRSYVAGQSRKVLEARAKKQEAAWLRKSKTR